MKPLFQLEYQHIVIQDLQKHRNYLLFSLNYGVTLVTVTKGIDFYVDYIIKKTLKKKNGLGFTGSLNEKPAKRRGKNSEMEAEEDPPPGIVGCVVGGDTVIEAVM